MPDRVCLIVDDESAIRGYLRAILERLEIQSFEAASATEALRWITTCEGRIDLLVTDILMPGDMNGIDLAYWVRNSYPKIPVLLISGFADDKEIQKGLSGFTFIPKPIKVEVMLRTIRDLLDASAK